jgi:hypothetical protein
MINAIRCFCRANTCSMPERTLARAAFARARGPESRWFSALRTWMGWKATSCAKATAPCLASSGLGTRVLTQAERRSITSGVVSAGLFNAAGSAGLSLICNRCGSKRGG